MVKNYKEVLYDNVELETKSLLLRKFKKEDVPDILEYGSDEQALEYIIWEGVKTEEDALGSIVDYYWSTPGIFAIELKANNKCIGCIDLRMEPEHEKASFGFILNRKYWNKGYMTEALSALLDLCFEKLKLNRVESCHYAGNEGSGRVMEKCGMKLEGMSKQGEKVKNVFRDVVYYGIVKEDWIIKSNMER